MKMYKSVFQFPNYGMKEFYSKKAEIKNLLAKRKGKTKKVRKELLTTSRKKRLQKTIEQNRKIDSRIIDISNKSVSEEQLQKHKRK